jgi:hypothetical protein
VSEPSLFHEEQQCRQGWVWLIVLAVAGLTWWTFIRQVVLGHPIGEEPLPDWVAWLVLLIIGVGLPLLFLRLRLIVDVTAEQVVIRFSPLSRRVIPIADIEAANARTYDPIKEYGGWGIKGWSRRSMAYNMSGNRGVELTLRDGRRVMLGSQRADELAQVIERQRKPQRPRHA